MQPRFTLSIGTKIFGVAASMLGLLIGVAYLNYVRIRQVNNELVDIADYLAPLTENIANINIHVLEQEIHFERMVRYYQTDAADLAKIEAEEIAFEERGQQVDKDIAAAIKLAEKAAVEAYKPADILEIARVRPLLDVLEEDHQKLHNRSVEIIDLLESNNSDKAEILIEQLADFEDIFDTRIQGILFELTDFIEHSATEAQAHEQETIQTSWWLTAIASGLGVTFASLVTAGLVRPVKKLVEKTQAVKQGELDVELPVYSFDEIGTLTDSFNHMVQKIREKEHLKTTFGQYVDPRIVETLLDQQTQTNATERQMMTLLFCDMEGFSTISELLTPTGLVTLINQYFTLTATPIKEHHGVINQFIGDAVSAFWGPPFVAPEDHAKLACYAALEQFDQLAKLRRSLPDLLGIRKGLPKINIRVGLASGDVLAGNIGSERSKSYTVMGATTRRTQQLEEANKVYGTRILMDEKTKELAGETIETREIAYMTWSETSAPDPIYELLGISGCTNETWLRLRDFFQTALTAYRDARWTEAKSLFQSCLDIMPNDGPSKYYLTQLEAKISNAMAC
ncbi:MAG: HAMP domain-containing protein [Leptolyngbya sp. SIO3F4]|nr:HAMP domain-containing protein [Leptolyngbya sp. SIO3F4]